MSKTTALAIWRIFFGLLSLVAVGTQLFIHIQHHHDVANFFGFFTNLSNIFAAVVLLVGALWLLQGRKPDASRAEDTVRGASVVAIVIVGIVYGVLLRNEDLGSLLPWINIVVHFITPAAVLLDWLYAPPQSAISVKQLRYWLIYPLLYLIYTLVRGAAVGWYPYPFLNPSKAGGAGGVALHCLAIFIAFVLVGWLLITAANSRNNRLALRPA